MERIESLKVFIVTSHKLRGKIEQGGFTKKSRSCGKQERNCFRIAECYSLTASLVNLVTVTSCESYFKDRFCRGFPYRRASKSPLFGE
jgi:hypothetical protein